MRYRSVGTSFTMLCHYFVTSPPTQNAKSPLLNKCECTGVQQSSECLPLNTQDLPNGGDTMTHHLGNRIGGNGNQLDCGIWGMYSRRINVMGGWASCDLKRISMTLTLQERRLPSRRWMFRPSAEAAADPPALRSTSMGSSPCFASLALLPSWYVIFPMICVAVAS